MREINIAVGKAEGAIMGLGNFCNQKTTVAFTNNVIGNGYVMSHCLAHFFRGSDCSPLGERP